MKVLNIKYIDHCAVSPALLRVDDGYEVLIDKRDLSLDYEDDVERVVNWFLMRDGLWNHEIVKMEVVRNGMGVVWVNAKV